MSEALRLLPTRSGHYRAVRCGADGRHSAASQFTETYGFAWTLAATGGGALVGILGALAGSPALIRPTRKAFGLVTAALLVGLGPLAWFTINTDVLTTYGTRGAMTFYGAIGLVLGAVALWKCGVAPFLKGLGQGALTSIVALAGLLVLQDTVLYMTY